ncbi:serine/threonine protein kinase [Gigaspora margarita]|uniref:Serine/threonine protein kinase n=1 Tax=Gigaspora margarita TaxID=4874 RepID=A0A8H4ASG4_GIGMA|nr:serine/threonine protein kinase [Gigaspora margarita]
MSTIKIWCLERGSSCSSAFYVTVKSNSNIFDLKKAIFNEISVSCNIKPKDLNLWKVNFNQNISDNVPFDSILRDEMRLKNPSSLIRDIFRGAEGSNIRIIFETPATSDFTCLSIHSIETTETYSGIVNEYTRRFISDESDGFGWYSYSETDYDSY